MSIRGDLYKMGIESDGEDVNIFGGNLNARNIAFSLGKFWYVDPNRSTSGNGKSWNSAFNDLAEALLAVGSNDYIFCAPAGYTGNYSTPLDAGARRVSLIGVNAGRLGLGPWFGPSVTSLPSLTIKARGWMISGFEFDNPATSYGIQLNTLTDATEIGSYTEIKNCLFTGGRGGINFKGGGTYINIHHNRFDEMAGTGAGDGAIMCTDSSHQCPIMCHVHNNEFMENITHIGMGKGTARGFNSSIIGPGNVFQVTGGNRTCTLIMDLRANKGGNTVVNNWFGCDTTDYNTAGTIIRTNSSDEGMDNWCANGYPTTDDIAH